MNKRLRKWLQVIHSGKGRFIFKTPSKSAKTIVLKIVAKFPEYI